MKRFLLSMLFAGALPAADSGITPPMNAFTTDTYKQLARGDSNLILSPFNIATALSMALAGAGGQTATEMRSVLHLQQETGFDAKLAALLADRTKAGNTGGNELHAANGLWVQKGFDILPAFANTLRDGYQASPVALDFGANPEGARSQINRWTEDQTKSRIKDLFPAGAFDARTRLVLTSAIYFYGKWQVPFVPSLTKPAPFTLGGGGTTQANFMNQTGHFGYAETPSAQILELRYVGSGIAFDILLPKASGGLSELEKSINVENLTGWLGSLTSRNVQLSLPKFRAESSFSLPRTLSAMGMPSAFTSKADFSGINPQGGLAITEVVHKAFVDVAEAGTEAAAATGIAISLTSARMPEPPVVFRADHPFIFMIRDTRSGAILFVGRLMNPKS